MPTASLTIDAFYTTLTVPGGDKPNRINILGSAADGDWNSDHITYFRNAADRHLTAAGFTRTDGWQYDAGRDVHTAAVAVTERSPA